MLYFKILLRTFQTEISASLESLKKKLKVLINTKEQWEEIKTHIQVNGFAFRETMLTLIRAF